MIKNIYIERVRGVVFSHKALHGNVNVWSMHSQIFCSGTVAAVAARRVRNVLGSVLGRDGWMFRTHEVKLVNTASGNWPLCSSCKVTYTANKRGFGSFSISNRKGNYICVW